MKNARKIKRSKEDWIIDIIIYAIMTLVIIVTLYPFYYVIILAFNDAVDATRGGIYLFPRKFSLENFKALFEDGGWGRASFISVSRTVVGSAFGVMFTSLVAYAMSFEHVLFRNTYNKLYIFTMYFSGGMIPFYILLKNIHMLNTFWVYVIPGMFSVYHMLIMVNFFKEIPSSLYESARLDGAGDMRIFFQITLPLSKACLATMTLFNAVSQWNAWIDSAYYVTREELRPMAYLMMEIINKSNAASSAESAVAMEMASTAVTTTTSLQMAAMVLAVGPILCIYPFLQKYFVKGVMVGSVKG